MDAGPIRIVELMTGASTRFVVPVSQGLQGPRGHEALVARNEEVRLHGTSGRCDEVVLEVVVNGAEREGVKVLWSACIRHQDNNRAPMEMTAAMKAYGSHEELLADPRVDTVYR